ncbi:uncharacterized protein LOC110862170 [Folsomia candida]|uniref:uncharacterized protein LOC110862170 n=1 Tax=Folsomia candida TaxID=158441 RepID=UPI001604A4CA|nr:uncharacterized protein LOC110862170 [Folsomia candida]
MSPKKYYIIEFPPDKYNSVPVELVPSHWVIPAEKVCLWPPNSGPSIRNLIKKGTAIPDVKWGRVSYARIIGNYDDYEVATKKLQVAEDTSNLESETEPESRLRSKKIIPDIQPSSTRGDVTSSSDEEDSDANKNSPPSGSLLDNLELDQPLSIPEIIPETEEQSNLQVGNQVVTGDTSFVVVNSQELNDLRLLISRTTQSVLTLLEKQAEDIKDIKALLINVKQRPDGRKAPNFSAIPKLPLDNEVALAEFESWLEVDSNRELLVEYLAFSTATQIEASTRKILKKLFTNEFGRRINFTGKGNKTSMKNLKLLEVVKETVRNVFTVESVPDPKNPSGRIPTDDIIQTAAMNWFRSSKSRCNDDAPSGIAS